MAFHFYNLFSFSAWLAGTGSGEINHKNTKEKRKWKQDPGRWHFSELASNEGHFSFTLSVCQPEILFFF